MARASVPTLLSLDRWARIMHVNPVHFAGAVGSLIWPASGACEDIWPQYSWQTTEELVGREDVGMAIATAEEDIKNALGKSAAATWEIDEAHGYSFPDMRPRLVQTEYGEVIAPGRRAVTLIEAEAAVVRSDPDNDTWFERATVTVTTDVTDIRQIKLYFAGHDGDPEWEIRPLRSVSISSGVATITLDAWLLIDPDLWEAYPSNNDFTGIDVTVNSNFVDAVDVYREYNDTSQNGVIFYAQGSGGGFNYCCGGVGCDVCSGANYGGCFSVVDSRLGSVTPYPASYEGGVWSYTRPVDCRPTQRITLSYYAGLVDKQYAAGKSLDPLSHYMAETITWLSVARLPKALCSCNNLRDTVEALQVDATVMREPAANATLFARFEKMDMFNCPFGTRVGEVRAWQRVMRLIGPTGSGGGF